MFSSDCASVCVCAQRIGQSDSCLLAPKRLKLQTSDLKRVFPGSDEHDPLKFMENGAWPGSRGFRDYFGIKCSKAVTAMDFKRDSYIPND